MNGQDVKMAEARRRAERFWFPLPTGPRLPPKFEVCHHQKAKRALASVAINIGAELKAVQKNNG
jgi:hypothetical protein